MNNIEKARKFLNLVDKGCFWLSVKYDRELSEKEGVNWKEKEPYKSLINDYKTIKEMA